jgi:hypothetical protein
VTRDDEITVVEQHETVSVKCCYDCGAEIIKGGPIVPTAEVCATAFERCTAGRNWAWCSLKRRFSQWIPEVVECA